MKRKKIIRILLILVLAGGIIGGGSAYYIFNMPHRNIQNTKTDFRLTSTQIVNEYLEDAMAANEKYLADDGDSKILEVQGKIAKISNDFHEQKVVLLKDENSNAGVSCSFTLETNKDAEGLKIGQEVKIKGVIRSGASYDEDLEFYENVILEKCDVVN